MKSRTSIENKRSRIRDYSAARQQGQLILEAAEETADGIAFRVRVKHPPRCPACSKSRVSYHSRYVRRLRDLPWQGRPVEIHLQTRRFRCRNQECAQKIFAERLPAVAARKARETTRLCEIVGLVGYALGGLPGERLLNRLRNQEKRRYRVTPRQNTRPRSKPTESASAER